jgi:hypothetical protein
LPYSMAMCRKLVYLFKLALGTLVHYPQSSFLSCDSNSDRSTLSWQHRCFNKVSNYYHLVSNDCCSLQLVYPISSISSSTVSSSSSTTTTSSTRSLSTCMNDPEGDVTLPAIDPTVNPSSPMNLAVSNYATLYYAEPYPGTTIVQVEYAMNYPQITLNSHLITAVSCIGITIAMTLASPFAF